MIAALSDQSHRKPLFVVGAAILSGHRCLIGRRKAGGDSGGRWEFPGGKVEAEESAEEALAREILEELGTAVSVGDWIGRGTARTDGRLVVLDVYAAILTGSALPTVGKAHDEIRWITAGELGNFSWAAADLPIVELVGKLLQGKEE